MNEVKRRGELVIRRDVIAREHGLNDRQSGIVEVLLEQGSLGVEDIEAHVPGVHRRTLQRDLRRLVELGIASTSGAARAVRYRLKIKALR